MLSDIILRFENVEINEIEGKPGAFHVIIHSGDEQTKIVVEKEQIMKVAHKDGTNDWFCREYVKPKRDKYGKLFAR